MLTTTVKIDQSEGIPESGIPERIFVKNDLHFSALQPSKLNSWKRLFIKKLNKMCCFLIILIEGKNSHTPKIFYLTEMTCNLCPVFIFVCDVYVISCALLHCMYEKKKKKTKTFKNRLLRPAPSWPVSQRSWVLILFKPEFFQALFSKLLTCKLCT